jgi:hypothetical protein
MTKIIGRKNKGCIQAIRTKNGHLGVIMVHMKGLYGRPREIEDRKYGMCVCSSVIIIIIINNVLYNNNKEKNERQSKMGVYVVYGR